jgi:hypothetical protein
MDEKENGAARAAVREVVAPGSPRFALHTLGWRAFQDLCAAVLREVWGQSVQAFADSNDAGRDGAFYGTWAVDSASGMDDVPEGPFVLQCKHTKSADATLSASMLGEEFDKVGSLVRRGLCGTYVLLTNARVTGAAEATIRKRLMECGVSHPLVLDGQWLSDMIAGHRGLRMFVPRVYGLGDLSQILDERAYAQASMLMASAPEQVSTFVVTSAYRKAAQALQDHGFVLLLGEPAVGKSAIAMMLAISAADRWGCLTVKARTSEELVRRWNPYEKDQYFWVDDAFGTVRHEERLTHDWVRDLPHVMTAIRNGARVVLTSRSYIYAEARGLLKTYAYPLLREQQVIVDVADISRVERQQILYNHITAGDQPTEVRALMKPHLEAAADATPFHPEAARRLGLQAFTHNLPLTRSGIESFMGHPHQFLDDIYSQLDTDAHAALVLVYVASRRGLASPLRLGGAERGIIERVGATVGGTGRALMTLTGTFLRQEAAADARVYWFFKHPTLREGFAVWLASQHHLLSVILTGMDDDALLDLTDCLTQGSQHLEGTLLRMPTPLYPSVAKRLTTLFKEWPEGSCWTGEAVRYLSQKCSDSMLQAYVDINPSLPPLLTEFESFSSVAAEPRLLARLYGLGLLPETHRKMAVDRMADLAVTCLDTSWLDDEPWKILLTNDDRVRIFSEVRRLLVPRLREAVNDDWTSSIFWRPAGIDDERKLLERALYLYQQAFAELNDKDTAEAFASAIKLNTKCTKGPNGYSTHNKFHSPDLLPDQILTERPRNIFSDVTDGGILDPSQDSGFPE